MAKREGRSLAIVFIDFAKAFDTESHCHMLEILTRRGVDKLLCHLVQDS